MKKSVKLLTALVLTMSLLLGLSATAFAADSSVEFAGKQAGYTFKPGSEFSASDLFDNFKNVMPGDVLTENITITNNAKDCDYIKLYMRAVPHGEKNAMQDKVAAEETQASMTEFLNQLSMKVWQGDKLLFDAKASEVGGLKENVFLADVRHGKTVNLKVELTVPLSLGNEYADRVGEVDWAFVSEARNDPKPPILIQTGQLKWPIPVMGTLGVLLIALGAAVLIKKKDDRA